MSSEPGFHVKCVAGPTTHPTCRAREVSCMVCPYSAMPSIHPTWKMSQVSCVVRVPFRPWAIRTTSKRGKFPCMVYRWTTHPTWKRSRFWCMVYSCTTRPTCKASATFMYSVCPLSAMIGTQPVSCHQLFVCLHTPSDVQGEYVTSIYSIYEWDFNHIIIVCGPVMRTFN